MVHIQYQDIEIGSITKSSGVFSGTNRQWSYKHTSKLNQAFGKVSGRYCSISNIASTLDDRDTMDKHTDKKIPAGS